MVKKVIALGFVVSLFSMAQARVMMIEPPNLERFKTKTTLNVSGIVTPKVVTFETDDYLGSFIAVQDQATSQFLPHKLERKLVNTKVPTPPEYNFSATINGTANNLSDNKSQTFVTFDPANITHAVSFKRPHNYPITGLRFQLAQDTFAPKKITIEAKLGSDEWKPIIRNQNFSSTIKFPEVSPSEMRISFEAPNLLRINEIDFITPNSNDQKTQIIFYASEGQNIIVWSEPDFGQKRIPVSRTMSSALRTDDKTPVFSFSSSQANPIYNPDFDQDGLVDRLDLCPKTADPANADIDGNGRGDVCEDPDQDGRMSSDDNCPFVYNRDQADEDADGTGDACDDTEDRLSEQSNIWMTASFMVMIFALLFLILRSALNQKK